MLRAKDETVTQIGVLTFMELSVWQEKALNHFRLSAKKERYWKISKGIDGDSD